VVTFIWFIVWPRRVMAADARRRPHRPPNRPLPAHNYVGEYQGLAGLRRGFAAAFTLASPQAQNGPTDIFFAQIGPG
jgi:hypothetical protein